MIGLQVRLGHAGKALLSLTAESAVGAEFLFKVQKMISSEKGTVS